MTSLNNTEEARDVEQVLQTTATGITTFAHTIIRARRMVV